VRYLASLVAVAVTALMPGSVPEGAEPSTNHPIHIPASLERVALEFWEARGVELPSEPEIFERTAKLEFKGWATSRDKRIWLSRPAVLDIRSSGIRRGRACALYVHERGHTAGLTHESHWSIMAPRLHGIPRACRRWAKLGSGATYSPLPYPIRP
jgi:hypothetical protein